MTSQPANRPWQILVVAAIIALEAIAVLVALGWLIVELIIETPDSYAAAVFLILLCGLALAFVVAVAWSLLRGRAWARTAAVFCQLLMIALGAGSIQGDTGVPLAGAAFIVPAFIAGVLLFSHPVAEYTHENPRASD